jgi:hypothetical protein
LLCVYARQLDISSSLTQLITHQPIICKAMCRVMYFQLRGDLLPMPLIILIIP